MNDRNRRLAVAAELNRIRAEQGLSVREVARRVGTSAPVVSNWFIAERPFAPDNESLAKIAKAFPELESQVRAVFDALFEAA